MLKVFVCSKPNKPEKNAITAAWTRVHFVFWVHQWIYCCDNTRNNEWHIWLNLSTTKGIHSSTETMTKLWVNWFCRCGLTTLDCSSQITWNQASKFKQITFTSSAEVTEYLIIFAELDKLTFILFKCNTMRVCIYIRGFSKQDAELTLPLSFLGSESKCKKQNIYC